MRSPSSTGPPVVYPDQNYTFTLAYLTDSFSTDKVAVKTTGDGLLKSISTTSRDERAAVAGSLVALAGELAKAAATFSSPGSVLALEAAPRVQSGFAPPPVAVPFKQTLLVDPYDPELSAKVSDALRSAGVDGVSLRLAPSSLPSESRTPEEIRAFCQTGACYRRVAPVTLRVEDDATQTAMERITILPNNGVVGRLDFERRSFVENKAVALFDQGMLVEISYDDPSTAAAVANAPVELVRDIVEIPASAFGAGRARLDAERQLLQAEEALLRQEIALLKAQAEYQAAQAARQQQPAAQPSP